MRILRLMRGPERPGDRGEGPVRGDSDGYQSDSGIDSDGYQSGEADGVDEVNQLDEADQFDEGLRPLIEQWQSMREGWWNKAGYETYWDLVKEDEAGWHRMGFPSIYGKRKKRPKSASELPDPTPAEIDRDALAADATRPRRARARQVNVRLTELGYQALCESAKVYGLRPSTLARLLIHRGALAVLEDQKSSND